MSYIGMEYDDWEKLKDKKPGEGGGGGGGKNPKPKPNPDDQRYVQTVGDKKKEQAAGALGSLASLTSNLAAAHTASFKGLSPGSNLVSKSGKDPAPRTLDSITKDDDGNINYSAWHKQIKEDEKNIGNIIA